MAGCWKLSGGYSPSRGSRRQSAQQLEKETEEDPDDEPSTSAQDNPGASVRKSTFAGLRYRRCRRSKPRRHKQLQRGKKLFSVRLEDDDDEDEDDFYVETTSTRRIRASSNNASASVSRSCTLRKTRFKRLFLCGRGIISDPEDGTWPAWGCLLGCDHVFFNPCEFRDGHLHRCVDLLGRFSSVRFRPATRTRLVVHEE